jgi:N-methylhydantoinase A/acetophenone carboxylase
MRAELSATWDKCARQNLGAALRSAQLGRLRRDAKTTANRTTTAAVAGLVGAATARGSAPATSLPRTSRDSFDVGLVVDQSVRNYEFNPVIDTWIVAITMLQSLSIGAGGGSIASINGSWARLEVGPRRRGVPRPVAYNLGGTEPTVTDADVVSGTSADLPLAGGCGSTARPPACDRGRSPGRSASR